MGHTLLPLSLGRIVASILAYLCFYPVLVIAKNHSTEPTVEIKRLVPEEKIADFSKRAHLKSNAPLKRVVCFFDTESLSLFQHTPKVILRSRYDSNGEADTTVKVRSEDGRAAGSDCEFDEVVGKPKIMSCSVTDKEQKKNEIKQANAGRNIKKIFSKQQELASESAFGRLDWRKLKPYGPVKGIQVWKKITLPGGPDLTVECWKLPARSGKPPRMLFEVSAKVPLSEEAKTSKWIAGLTRFSGGENDQESETKTQAVLEYFKSTTEN